ncbi:MAG TPA: aldo/keto reductase [Terriglobia bacterium]|nr:aldo/keto reductase [Terriglobia bacterium]
MEKRKLGNSGIEVAPLALGGNVFGWTVDEATGFMLLDAFVDAGFNLIDTADVYPKWAPGCQGGESEELIGKWLERRGRRNDVVIATKVGWEFSPDRKGLSKEYILRSAEGSLRRLRTDYIDLYQSHKDDPETPLEETLGAYDQLIREGKVRAIGASNYSAERLRQALEASEKNGLPRYESLQPEYSLAERAGFESGLEQLCREKNLGVITYFSLASGFLTGKYRSEADLEKSARGQMVRKYMNERGKRILAALEEVARDLNSTPAQVAIAWLIARPSVTAPIASARTIEQLNDLVAATKLKLDSSAIDRLNKASDYAAIAQA